MLADITSFVTRCSQFTYKYSVIWSNIFHKVSNTGFLDDEVNIFHYIIWAVLYDVEFHVMIKTYVMDGVSFWLTKFSKIHPLPF